MKNCRGIVRLMLSTAVAALPMQIVNATDPAPSHGDSRLRERLADLEREVAQLRAAAGDDAWLTEACAVEIRGIVQDVLADADTRASLLQSGATAGWDNGFFIASTDGNFRLNISGQMQFRYLHNNQDDGPEDDNRGGFENARTQLIFTGHVIDPSWIYRVQSNFNRDGGDFFLEDAYIGRALGNGWTFLAGQFRVPMLREFLVTEPNQQSVERSLVHQEFSADRTQGAAIDYRSDHLHVTLGYTDGHPATGGFNQTALRRDTEYAFTARVEALLNGTWDQFGDFAGWRDAEFGLLLGGAVHYQKGEFGTMADELEVTQWTLDASAEVGGANLFAYVVGRHLDSAALSADQFGVVVQGGYFLTDQWEVFARYEWGDDDFGGEDLSVITLGTNYYVARQRLKWSADVGFGLNEIGATWGDGFIGSGGDMAGWRRDTAGNNMQVVARAQLQLLF